MQLKVGEIVEGTVKSLTKFGAFVALDATTTGLVHISEVAHAYVSDIHDYLTEGQTVKVMVIGLENGKINLSIKRAESPAPAPRQQAAPMRRDSAPKSGGQTPPPRAAADPPSANQDFEDRLKKFMQEADSRIADNRRYAEHKQRGRRR